MRQLNCLFPLITICSLMSALSSHAQGLSLNDNPLKIKLDSIVHKAASVYLKDSSANSVVIGVTYKGVRHFYRYGENIKGSGQLTPAGLYYNIGSVAKTFVATILVQAVVEHKVKLEDDIRKYLPGSYDDLQFQGKPIRLVDLANHTSGLPGTFHQYPAGILNMLKSKTLSEQARFFSAYNRDSLLLDLHNLAPDTIPGTQFRYNSSAYMLLTLLLERVYHKPYQVILSNYLQTHLKLRHTKPVLTEAELKMAAQGYDRNNKPVKYINLEGYYIGPSINSIVSDMTQYLEAQLKEKDAAVQLTHKQTFGQADGFGLGLGWMMNKEKGDKYFYHDGNTKIGFNSLCTIYPASQLGIVIIVNDVTSQEKVGQMENTIARGILETRPQ